MKADDDFSRLRSLATAFGWKDFFKCGRQLVGIEVLINASKNSL
jgi:hypothetical protein